jgi:hypothetical protein
MNSLKNFPDEFEFVDSKKENKQANILPITSIRQTKDLSSVIISVMQKKKKRKHLNIYQSNIEKKKRK